ncbi:MAG: C40 family peptidase [Enhydrobacter sp.]|nr:C40 family peptidase [Enhydrobacter sp.]
MALGTGRLARSIVRVLFRSTAGASLAIAALALAGTAGSPSPAHAQVKAPAKSKLKPPVKSAAKAAPKAIPQTDPSDSVADQLNARWQQENGAFSGFTSANPAGNPAPNPAVVPASFATRAVANDWGDRLVSRAMNYLGTPYRYGGTSPSTGFDCSGFVYFLYGAEFGQRIPRMPDGMASEGTPVARNDLQRGDIVFFGHRGRFTHVGIYAGNGQFVHATQRGSPVSVTPLDADYFRQTYMTAVRLPPR